MRTTDIQVRQMASIPEGVNVIPFIEMASAIVDDLESCARGKLKDQRLELIERNLACHFAQVSGAPTASSVTSKSIAGASTSFNRGNPTPITGTPYGQMAVQLDSTRCLVGILEGPVDVVWLGTAR